MSLERQKAYLDALAHPNEGEFPDEVDTSALVASPQPTGKFHPCRIMRTHSTARQYYIMPKAGTPLFVWKHLVREGKR